MEILRFISVLLLVIAVVGSLAGCSVNNAKNEHTKVRIAYFPNITHAQALIGRAEGQFQQALGDATPIE